jgi:hypothetical protein
MLARRHGVALVKFMSGSDLAGNEQEYGVDVFEKTIWHGTIFSF